MASYKVQDKTGTATAASSIGITWNNNTTSGNSIVVVVGTASASTNSVTSITDSQGNSYTQVFTNEIAGSVGDVEVWIAKNIVGGATPTITVNLSGLQTGGAIAREYYGLDTLTLLNLSDGAATGTGTSATSNIVKTTQAPQMLLGIMGTGLTGTISLGGSYQNLVSVSNGIQVALEDLYVTSTGSYTANFNDSNSVAWECGIVALNESPHGTTTSTSSTSSTSSSTSSTSSSTSSTSTSASSTSVSTSSTSSSTSTSVTTISTSSTSSSISSTSTSSTSTSTSISSTSSSISSTSISSTSMSSTSSSSSISSTSTSFSSTSSSISSTSISMSSTSLSSTSSSSSTSTTTIPSNLDYTYQDMAASQGSIVFGQSTSWVAPVGVTSVTVELWGGGGGGAGSSTNPGGTGGGGGGYSSSILSVTAGTSYTISIGVGGAAGSSAPTTGGNGGDTFFNSTGTLLAKGGTGGGLNGGTVGQGGAAASGVGDTRTSGGNGGTGSSNGGGGGGGGSGGDKKDGGIGGNGGVGVGGTAGSNGTGISNGAFGGAGGTNGVGISGTPPGGGGGGGSVITAGGNGGGGIVRITWSGGTPLPTTGADLTNRFTSPQTGYVQGDDGDYFIQYGSEYVISQFQKKWTNNTDSITLTWHGRSTESTLISPIYLQIYNNNSAAWETLDTETLVLADTDFTLNGTQTTNLSNYYDSNNQVSVRVYQLVL